MEGQEGNDRAPKKGLNVFLEWLQVAVMAMGSLLIRMQPRFFTVMDVGIGPTTAGQGSGGKWFLLKVGEYLETNRGLDPLPPRRLGLSPVHPLKQNKMLSG